MSFSSGFLGYIPFGKNKFLDFGVFVWAQMGSYLKNKTVMDSLEHDFFVPIFPAIPTPYDPVKNVRRLLDFLDPTPNLTR